jgi:riboflavin synthase
VGAATTLAGQLAPGASIAVSGVCLTVVATDGEGMHMDVSPETARVTSLGSLRRGSLVNLERPVRLETLMGGHFVQGHVDATGTVVELRPQGEHYWLTVCYPRNLATYLVHKGSIAVDGISLTIADLADDQFGVQIIPFTWEHTNLKGARAGDPVNVECDIIGKYVVRALEVGDYRPGRSSTAPSTARR